MYVVNWIAEIFDMVITDEGDFLFNVSIYQNYAYAQIWDIIPENKRDTRQILQAPGDAYFEHLHDRSSFPVATPCWIVSGGSFSGRNDSAADSCTHAPKRAEDPIQTMRERRYVIDEVCIVSNRYIWRCVADFISAMGS